MPRRNRVPFPARSKVTPLGQQAAPGFGQHPPEPPSTVTSCVRKEEYPVLPTNPRPPLPLDPKLRKQCRNSGNNAKIFSQIFKIDFLRFLAAGHPQPRSRSEPCHPQLTSNIADELNTPEYTYTIGEYYTQSNKSLKNVN